MINAIPIRGSNLCLPPHDYSSIFQALLFDSFIASLEDTRGENSLQNKFPSAGRSSTSDEGVQTFHRRREIELSYKTRSISKSNLDRRLRLIRINIRFHFRGINLSGTRRSRFRSWLLRWRRDNRFPRHSTTL